MHLSAIDRQLSVLIFAAPHLRQSRLDALYCALRSPHSRWLEGELVIDPEVLRPITARHEEEENRIEAMERSYAHAIRPQDRLNAQHAWATAQLALDEKRQRHQFIREEAELIVLAGNNNHGFVCVHPRKRLLLLDDLPDDLRSDWRQEIRDMCEEILAWKDPQWPVCLPEMRDQHDRELCDAKAQAKNVLNKQTNKLLVPA